MLQAMSSRLSSSFRLVDFFRLGGAMPEEVVNGHGSQMLNLWVGGVGVEGLPGGSGWPVGCGDFSKKKISR